MFNDLVKNISKENYNKNSKKNSKKRNTNINRGQFKSLLTEEMIVDIKNDIGWKLFCEKYSVCKKTYFNYRTLVFQKMGRSTKRVYETKIDVDEYREYRKEHTRNQTANHFRISKDLTYDYDRRIGLDLKEKRIQEQKNSSESFEIIELF